MERKYVVYKHTNKINGKVYIGITCRKVERRWNNGNGYRQNSYFYSAINKNGWDNFHHEILFNDLNIEQAVLMERKLIREHKSIQREFGYNLTSGGEKGLEISEETRKKMRTSHIGNINSEKTRRKISIAMQGEKHPMYGKNHSEESRRKIIENHADGKGNKNNFYGKKHSSETKYKMSNNHYDCSGINNPKARKIICLENGEVYNLLKDAANYMGTSASNISYCCLGKRKSAGKHPATGEKLKWMYYDEYLKLNKQA